MTTLPDALQQWPQLSQRLAPRPAIFLDYDGTLTAIRARPADATLDDRVRQTLRTLATRHFVAVVTGRGLADVRDLVGLPELTYAANHGLEIEGPSGSFEPDPTLRSTVAELREPIDALVAGVEGVVVEHKGLSIAIHVRLVDDAAAARIEAGVDAVLAEQPKLRKGTGKKVLELRPAIDWHKGAAVRWLCERIGTAQPPAVPLFIGDDRTDEDALAQVRDGGVGIVVGTPGWKSSARYRLADPAAVHELLQRLAG